MMIRIIGRAGLHHAVELSQTQNQILLLLHELEGLIHRSGFSRIGGTFHGFPFNGATTRVQILHVVNRIVVGLLLRKIQIEFEMRAGAAQREEKAGCVAADFVDHFLQRDRVAGAESAILGALGKQVKTGCRDHVQKVMKARNDLAKELGIGAIDPCPLTGGSGGGTIKVYATRFPSA
jgi:hypothetical protein